MHGIQRLTNVPDICCCKAQFWPENRYLTSWNLLTQKLQTHIHAVDPHGLSPAQQQSNKDWRVAAGKYEPDPVYMTSKQRRVPVKLGCHVTWWSSVRHYWTSRMCRLTPLTTRSTWNSVQAEETTLISCSSAMEELSHGPYSPVHVSCYHHQITTLSQSNLHKL